MLQWFVLSALEHVQSMFLAPWVCFVCVRRRVQAHGVPHCCQVFEGLGLRDPGSPATIHGSLRAKSNHTDQEEATGTWAWPGRGALAQVALGSPWLCAPLLGALWYVHPTAGCELQPVASLALAGCMLSPLLGRGACGGCTGCLLLALFPGLHSSRSSSGPTRDWHQAAWDVHFYSCR